jgi:hypothetical protein
MVYVAVPKGLLQVREFQGNTKWEKVEEQEDLMAIERGMVFRAKMATLFLAK